MINKKAPKERNVETVSRERAPIPWRYGLLSLLCALILGAGFFFAAKQHFASVDYCMKNSDMRKTREKLEAEQRKLKVEREEVSSPATIEKAGLKMGLKKFTSADFQFIDAVKNIPPAENVRADADSKNKTPNGGEKAGALKDTKAAAGRSVETGKKDQSARSARTDVNRPAAKDILKTLIAKK
jgi:cell division protein FtsL